LGAREALSGDVVLQLDPQGKAAWHQYIRLSIVFGSVFIQ
jgi:hypothetical protein